VELREAGISSPRFAPVGLVGIINVPRLQREKIAFTVIAKPVKVKQSGGKEIVILNQKLFE